MSDTRSDRFQGSLEAVSFGMASGRSAYYWRYCGRYADESSGWEKDKSIVSKFGSDLNAFITAYCSDELYENVNRALSTNDEGGLRRHGKYIQMLRRALKAQIDAGRNVTSGYVYRWMTLDKETLARYRPGVRFLWPNFISTSWRRDVWYGNVRFDINLRGEGLTYAVDVRRQSPYPQEKEVLLYPYSGFQVLAVTREGGTTVVSMKTVDTKMLNPPTHGAAMISRHVSGRPTDRRGKRRSAMTTTRRRT